MPISILLIKIAFYEIFTNFQAEICPKIKNAPNLLKFGTFGTFGTFEYGDLNFNVKKFLSNIYQLLGQK